MTWEHQVHFLFGELDPYIDLVVPCSIGRLGMSFLHEYRRQYFMLKGHTIMAVYSYIYSVFGYHY
jgi:hypothetical protein